MSSLATSTYDVQPLSQPEKKFLYEFWRHQWHDLKSAPACQNRSEEQLRKKFDAYVPINISRRLERQWNKLFAGRYVLGEPEPREQRDSLELRVLTKRWKWLCLKMGFEPWPGPFGDAEENLDNIEIDVRDEPFGLGESFTTTSSGKSSNSSEHVNDNRVWLAEDFEAAHTLQNLRGQPQQELPYVDLQLIETARSHYHSMRETLESYVIDREAIARNNPHFKQRVVSHLLQGLSDLEYRGHLSSKLANTVRSLVIQDSV